MADLRHRLPLQSSSYSFGDLPAPGSIPRPLKRRLTDAAEDPFVTTQPNMVAQLLPSQNTPSDSSRRLPSTHRGTTSIRQTSLVAQLPTMDPSPFDPGAVFIHPPFIAFPDAHLYKDGLTYNLMAEHPEWFLDPADYITTVNSVPGAIRYPPQLEPPRGWCPARKKDIKDGWAEGEEPRLRCTFCRRTYAGVNAKSMWRRHVYEKHKIAMSNRRDNNERKGRGSNKENNDRDTSRVGPDRNRRGTINQSEDVTSSTSIIKHPYRQFSTNQVKETPITTAPRPQSPTQIVDNEVPALQEPPKESDDLDAEIDALHIPTSSSTPPLTPGLSPSGPLSRLSAMKGINESPYNPLLTPSFRHSPARLPSDQPWRFPSPSHPLHSSAQELSLSMLIHGEGSPLVSGLDVSPLVIVPKSERRKRSIFSSPCAIPANQDRETCSDGEGADSTKRPVKSTPRKLIYDGTLPTPFTDRIKFGQHRIPESPLGRSFFSQKRQSLAAVLQANDSWQTPAKSPLGKGLLGPIQLDGDDPFMSMLYKPFSPGMQGVVGTPCRLSPPTSSPETESPVLRSSQLSSSQLSEPSSSKAASDGAGLGIGLMEGFSLKDPAATKGVDNDNDLMFIYDGREEDVGMQLADGSPAPLVLAGRKTRRGLFGDISLRSLGDSEMQESSQPKKRRRTVSGRD